MRIVVYCSSKENIPQSYKDDAALIGNYIGINRHTLVYGGIALGLMEITAAAAHRAGGRVVGVVPVTKKQMSHKINDEDVLACDLNDRKAKMMMMGDLFIVLPGGYGTLDELVSTFSLLTFTGDTRKRIIVLNRDGIFNPILSQLQLMVDRGMMPAEHLSRIMTVTSGHECCEAIANSIQTQLHSINTQS